MKKKTRKTLPSMIRNADSLEDAMRLAMWGENPPKATPVFNLISTMFWNGQVPNGNNPEWIATMKATFTDQLWKIFATPILNLDSARFLEAAEAINRISTNYNRGQAEDSLRLYLLSWKHSGKHPTMEKLKANWGNKRIFEARQVYRIAKELGLRIRTNKARSKS